MAIAFRKTRQERRVEGEHGGWIDWIESVLLINRLPADDRPAALPLLEKIIETSHAHDVDEDAVNRGALIDGHARLRDGAMAGHVAGPSAERMQNHDAPVEALPADFDEILGGPLKPRGRHPALGMPHRGEALPVSGVAPQDPVVDRVANRPSVRNDRRCSTGWCTATHSEFLLPLPLHSAAERRWADYPRSSLNLPPRLATIPAYRPTAHPSIERSEYHRPTHHLTNNISKYKLEVQRESTSNVSRHSRPRPRGHPPAGRRAVAINTR